ncbi:histidine kinase [Kitasatospora sp. NBC_01266]
MPFRLSPRRVDLAIATAGLGGGLLMLACHAYDEAPHITLWLRLASLVAMAVLELFRRRRPILTVTIGGLVFLAGTFTGILTITVIMYTDLLYAGTLYGPRRMPLVLQLTGAGSSLVIAGVIGSHHTIGNALGAAIWVALIFLAPVWTALLVRRYREQAGAERLRAERITLLAELDRRAAVAAERARMARELHDMVANHLSAIAIQATGAQALAGRQQRGVEDPVVAALAVIRENSVQGLAEMRQMIGVLRADSGQPADYRAPRLDALDSLLAQVRAAGRDAGLSVEVEQLGSGEHLPVPVELAAYRIVQESLTNALKHAGRGIVRLRLHSGQERVEIAVESPYRPQAGPALPGAKAGLVGMRERAQLLGGSFEAGPDGGLWRVRAMLPVRAAAESEGERV